MDQEQATDAAQQAVDAAVTLATDWGLSVIGAIALLIVGRMAAGIVKKSALRALDRAKVDEALHPFVSGMAYYLVLLVVGIAVLGLFGIETTSLVAVVGAAGLAIGLALQGTLSNFAAGVMLLIFRPFSIGHWVEVAGESGSVAEIGIFVTVLNTGDNVKVIIPNSAVADATIRNYAANPTRRIDLVMGISYNDDIEKALEIMGNVVRANPNVLDMPEPTIAVSELADSSVNFVVRPWVNGGDYWPTRFALTRALKEGLEAGGCSIPYPQQDLHVIDMPSNQAG